MVLQGSDIVKPSVALIDADFLIYAIGFTMDETTNKEGVQVKTHRDWIKIQQSLDFAVEELLNQSDCKSYIGFVGGKGNFRKDNVSTYKENRKDNVPPPMYNEIKERLCTKWRFHEVDNIESDDAVSICAKVLGYENVVAVFKDKDLKQIPCTHLIPGAKHNGYTWECTSDALLNPIGKLWIDSKRQLKGYGLRWKYAQMIIGDTSDNIPMLPSWKKWRISAPNLAMQVLEEAPKDLLYKKVLGQYIKMFGEGHDHIGLKKFMEVYNLVTLLDEESYGFKVPQPTKRMVEETPEKVKDAKEVSW